MVSNSYSIKINIYIIIGTLNNLNEKSLLFPPLPFIYFPYLNWIIRSVNLFLYQPTLYCARLKMDPDPLDKLSKKQSAVRKKIVETL